MYHIALSDSRFVLLLEAFKRRYRILFARLDFDREHLVFQLAVVGYQEVYLDIVAVLLSIVLRIEIQLVTVCGQHLSNSVLIEHSLVHIQLVTEDLLVDLIFQQFVLVKGVSAIEVFAVEALTEKCCQEKSRQHRKPVCALCTGSAFEIAAHFTKMVTIIPQSWTPKELWYILYLQ